MSTLPFKKNSSLNGYRQTYKLTKQTKQIPRHKKSNQKFSLSMNLSKTTDFDIAFDSNISKGKPVRNEQNYICENKKKLFNFHHDRLPKSNIRLFKEPSKPISPTKLYEIRKQTLEKKMNTNIELKESFNKEEFPISVSISKLNQTFSSQMSKNYKIKANCNPEFHQTAMIHRRATESSFMKRSETTKKQAFIDVFGEDSFPQSRKHKGPKQRNQTIFKSNEKKNHQTQKQKEKKSINRAEFHHLLKQLNAYSEEYNSHLKSLKEDAKEEKVKTEADTNPENPSDTIIDHKDIIYSIKKIAFDYKEKSVNILDGKGQTPKPDISLIKSHDAKFYSSLKEHKQKRLKLRQDALLDINNQNSNFGHSKGFKLQLRDKQLDSQKQEENMTLLLTITERALDTLQIQRQTINRAFKSKMTPAEKMQNFIENLIKVHTNSKFFCIPIHKIYDVLWTVRKPFELEGSYTFFKLIKAGDIKTLKKFYHNNNDYLYQIDSFGRSALIYAVQTKQQISVEFLLSHGMNVNYQGYNQKTALYYAIKFSDYSSTCLLLKFGASPWSSNSCSYRQILEKSDKKIRLAIKNARKIHLAIRLHRTLRQKMQLWNNLKQRINGEQLIRFI